MRTFFFAAAIGLITIFATVSPAQTAVAPGADSGIAAKYAIGEVKSVDAAAKQITIKTDAGSTVLVALSDKTTYKKLAPAKRR